MIDIRVSRLDQDGHWTDDVIVLGLQEEMFEDVPVRSQWGVWFADRIASKLGFDDRRTPPDPTP